MADPLRPAYKGTVSRTEVDVRLLARILGLAALGLAILGAGPFEGTWRLVSQTYEAGGWNIAPDDDPVRIEITAGGQGLRGLVWAGADKGKAVSWPAFVSDEGPLAIEILSRSVTPSGGVEARYRVRPSPTDDLVLEITEAYEPTEGGDALEGTVTVRFTGGTVNRGGYTLHRRFERER